MHFHIVLQNFRIHCHLQLIIEIISLEMCRCIQYLISFQSQNKKKGHRLEIDDKSLILRRR